MRRRFIAHALQTMGTLEQEVLGATVLEHCRVTLSLEALAIDLFNHGIVAADHGDHLLVAVPLVYQARRRLRTRRHSQPPNAAANTNAVPYSPLCRSFIPYFPFW